MGKMPSKVRFSENLQSFPNLNIERRVRIILIMIQYTKFFDILNFVWKFALDIFLECISIIYWSLLTPRVWLSGVTWHGRLWPPTLLSLMSPPRKWTDQSWSHLSSVWTNCGISLHKLLQTFKMMIYNPLLIS